MWVVIDRSTLHGGSLHGGLEVHLESMGFQNGFTCGVNPFNKGFFPTHKDGLLDNKRNQKNFITVIDNIFLRKQDPT